MIDTLHLVWFENGTNLLRAAALLLLIIPLVTCVYRRFLSPLSPIPGPPLAALASWWSLYHVMRRDKFYAVHQSFQRYGPVVRISPDTVAIGDYRLLKEVYQTKLDKHPAYAGFATNNGVPNAFSALTTGEAQGKRRGMLPHYATSNLVVWQDVMDEHLRELVACLKQKGRSVDILSLGAHALIDILGEVILDARIGAVDLFANGQSSYLARTINLWPKRGTLKGQMGPFMWEIASKIPHSAWQELVQSDATLAAFVAPQVHSVLAKTEESSRPCLVERLAKSKDTTTGKLWDVDHVISECIDHFLAGTETTSTTLAYLLWKLSIQPKTLASLQLELDEQIPSGNLLSINEAARLPYLNAVVKEALRLFAPVPGTLDRVVPDGGLFVHGYHIPAGSYVGLQAYTCNRDPTVWEDPESFTPERWLTPTPEMHAAFIPFSIGSRNCPGMNIAYTDLRLMTAAIARNFNLSSSADTTAESMHPLDMTAISPVSGVVNLDFVYRG